MTLRLVGDKHGARPHRRTARISPDSTPCEGSGSFNGSLARHHYVFVDEEGDQLAADIPEFTLLSPLDPAANSQA